MGAVKHRPVKITVTKEGVTVLRVSRSRRHGRTHKVTMGNTEIRKTDGEGKAARDGGGQTSELYTLVLREFAQSQWTLGYRGVSHVLGGWQGIVSLGVGV